MIIPTLRHDTLRQWPVERLPSFEDEDDDDAVETVRMPERPPIDPAPHTSPSRESQTSPQGNLSRASVRGRFEAAEQWLARLRLQFGQSEKNRGRLATALAAAGLFVMFEYLDARAMSDSVTSHPAQRAALVSTATSTVPRTNATPATPVLQAQSVESLPLANSPSIEAHSNNRRTTDAITHSHSSAGLHANTAQHSEKHVFDAEAARRALDTAASGTRRCTRNQMAGTVTVTFNPSGEVTDVTLGTLAGDIIQTNCVIQAFRNVKVAPFLGRAVKVRKTFAVSQ